MSIRVKAGASTEGMRPEMTDKFPVIERILRKYGEKQPTLTSGTDSKHGANSLHYLGLAGDFRIWAIANPAACRAELQTELGDDYDVVLESDHIHIEYDPA